MDVKPWDDETDMKELEKAVRQVATDGLLWGACKLNIYIFHVHFYQLQFLRILFSLEISYFYYSLINDLYLYIF